ncbi:MAG: acyl-CoA dehydrogenase [Pseudohongiellaceae bacterium]
MPAFKVPLRDMRFLLQDVFAANELFASMSATQEMTADLMDAILEEAAKITETLLAPLNQSGDESGCRLVNGKVSTPKGFADAYRAFADAGWVGLIGEPAYGGQGMPKMLSVLFEEMLMGSNPAFGLYPILTSGASLALSLHGTEHLKSTYLPRLYSGQWCATMCLTEPHAGSDLGIIRTRAMPESDGSFRLTGTKMFITAGDHDLSDNIIHFVLAKLPDAPDGSHGISLFLVPKLQATADGILGESNGVTCASLEHKMGLKASATCVLNFDNARGYLVGEINMGLTCMFTMMNYERLTMGLQGIGLAQNSYDLAVAYARERLQGRSADGAAAPEKPADPIIVHPDVRRMLLTMRANILAGRALCLYVASKLDIAKFHQSETEQQRALQLVDLLTPIAKAYCTDRGFEACVLGQQIFGGHGYIREWGVEQNVRDARIAQIYEGTNGIQALDLAGRKTVRCRGALLKVFLDEIRDFISKTEQANSQHEFTLQLKNCLHTLQECTEALIDAAANDKREIGAAAYSYMELVGLVAYGYMWLRILVAAGDKNVRTRHAADYLDSLEITADFFRLRLMPRGNSLAAEIKAGAASLMALKAEQF